MIINGNTIQWRRWRLFIHFKKKSRSKMVDKTSNKSMPKKDKKTEIRLRKRKNEVSKEVKL